MSEFAVTVRPRSDVGFEASPGATGPAMSSLDLSRPLGPAMSSVLERRPAGPAMSSVPGRQPVGPAMSSTNGT